MAGEDWLSHGDARLPEIQRRFTLGEETPSGTASGGSTSSGPSTFASASLFSDTSTARASDADTISMRLDTADANPSKKTKNAATATTSHAREQSATPPVRFPAGPERRNQRDLGLEKAGTPANLEPMDRMTPKNNLT